MGFFILLGISLLTAILGPLLMPRPKGIGAANLNDVTPPTATKGNPVPVVFGTCKVAPNVTWYGNVHAEEVRVITGERSVLNPFAANHSTATGYRYGADVAGVICHGPIDELLDIMIQDTSLLRYDASNTNVTVSLIGLHLTIPTDPLTPNLPQSLPVGDGPVTFTLNAPDLFGGDEKGGGVVAKIDFFFGKATQTASTQLAARIGSAVSNYKRICHAIIYDATFGQSPYLQAIYYIVRRCPWTVSVDQATSNINGSANAADVIYEIMTNAFWGLGRSPAMFDLASFTACASTLKAEDMGLDFKLDAQDDNGAAATITEILRHIDGTVYPHPRTGLITMKLFRADYVVADLAHITPSNARLSNFKHNDWPSTINEVRVTFLARGTAPNYAFVNDTVPAQNLANRQATGEVSSTDYDFPYFSNADRAQKAAFRMLRVVSAPLAAGQVTLNRQFHDLTVGAVRVLDWPEHGVSGLVVRVADITFGTLDANQITATIVEDVFATAPAVYTTPALTGWVPPTLTPSAAARSVAIPAPWFLVKADQFIGLNAVVRGSRNSTAWDGAYNNDPTVADSPVTGAMLTTGSPFCPAGTLVAVYPWNTAYQDEAGFLLTNLAQLETLLGTDAAGLARGDLLAWIGNADGGEVIAWRDVIPQSDGTYRINGILRGQFDTAPVDHKAGDTVYFFYPFGYTPYYPGQDAIGATPPTATSQTLSTSGYKLWAAIRGIVSSLPPGPPVAVIKPPTANTPSLDPRRAIMPLPPGDLKLNGTKDNVVDASVKIPDANSLTWVGRNRLTQTTTLVHDAAGVAIEASETYEVEVRHVSKTTGADVFGILHTFTGATSPLSYSNVNFESDLTAANGGTPVGAFDTRRTGGGIRFLIRSVRAGLKSYDIALPGFSRTQLAGYPIIPSLQFANISGFTSGVMAGSLSAIVGHGTGGGTGHAVVAGSLARIVGAGTAAAHVHGVAAGSLSAIVGAGTAVHVAGSIDATFLLAYYESDGVGNVFTGSRLDTWKDLTGGGHDLTRSAGTPTSTAGGPNAHPFIDFAGTEWFSNLSIALEGSATFFTVFKYSAIGAYHNFFDTLATMPSGNPPLIQWITNLDTLEADAESNNGNKVVHLGSFMTLVVHHAQAATKLGFKMRINGTQVAADNGVTTGVGTIPGSVGSPASFVASMFNRSGASALHGQVVAFGFYGRSKDGSETALENYLRAKYGTW